MCLVAFITVEIYQISDISGSFGSLVDSSASLDEVEVKTSAALNALIDFSVFEHSIGSLAADLIPLRISPLLGPGGPCKLV